MPRVAEGGRGGRGGSSGGLGRGRGRGRAGNRGGNQQKTSRGAVRLRIEPDPDEDDTTPSGRKRQYKKKGDVELGALDRAAKQVFQQALSNGGRVPHGAYQRIDELNATPGVTLKFNKKDLENRV